MKLDMRTKEGRIAAAEKFIDENAGTIWIAIATPIGRRVMTLAMMGEPLRSYWRGRLVERALLRGRAAVRVVRFAYPTFAQAADAGRAFAMDDEGGAMVVPGREKHSVKGQT